MPGYTGTQEELLRILQEEVKAQVKADEAQLRSLCEDGFPIPGKKHDPPSRLQGYLHDTLKSEMMSIFYCAQNERAYFDEVRAGLRPPPQTYVFYVTDQGQPIAGPYATPEEAVMNAQAMGVQPDPMTMLPPIIQKQSFWAKLFLLPKDTDFTCYGYFARDFKNLWEQMGRRIEAQSVLP